MMEGQSISLVNAILSTTILAVVLLGVSSLLGAGLGWLCGQNTLSAAVSQRIFQFLAYWAAISASKIFCLFWVIALFATIGVQKAKLAENQWQIAIANTFLGMRLGLILFLSITQIETTKSFWGGLGVYISNAYNTPDIGGLLAGAFSILVLVILFNQALSLLEKFLLNRVVQSSRRI